MTRLCQSSTQATHQNQVILNQQPLFSANTHNHDAVISNNANILIMGTSNEADLMMITHTGHKSKLDMQLSTDTLICFLSFKTTYELVHCVQQRNMYTFHIHAISFNGIYMGNACACMCHTYLTAIKYVHESIVQTLCNLHFILLSYVTQHIWLV